MSRFEVEKTWVTKAGLTAVATIIILGGKQHHRCGYVGVPADSLLFKINYASNKLAEISVHGGLTYSTQGHDIKNSYPIDSTDWFFGFDCAHCDDGIIELSEYDLKFYLNQSPPKSLDFVVTECESLAEQLAKILSGDSHD